MDIKHLYMMAGCSLANYFLLLLETNTRYSHKPNFVQSRQHSSFMVGRRAQWGNIICSEALSAFRCQQCHPRVIYAPNHVFL